MPIIRHLLYFWILSFPFSGLAQEKPNVILILADDLGYGDLSCHGNPVIKTPRLDQLRKEAAKLDRFYVSPTCSLTRAAILTGQAPFQVGVNHTIHGRSILAPDIPTLADAFQTAGYSTGIFGKWHLGDNAPSLPQFRGFEETYIHLGGGIGQSPDTWGNSYFNSTFIHNGSPKKSQGFCTTALVDQSITWLKNQNAANKPFFLYLPTNVPHSPWQIRPEWAESLLKQGVDPRLAKFYATIQHLDGEIGRLLDELNAEGIADNTIVIFTSDNGTAGKGYNAGMKGRKGTVNEGGVRVPFFIRWPKKIPIRESSQPIGHIDLFPTLCGLCGIDLPANHNIQGLDFSAWLRGGEMAKTNRFWFSHNGRWGGREDASLYRTRTFSVRSATHRLVGTELYDMIADPSQKNNIIEQRPEIAAKMFGAYNQWWKSLRLKIFSDVSIVLGDEREPVSRLCCHDWYPSDLAPNSKSAPEVWNQSQIRRYLKRMIDPKKSADLPELMGHWKVRFARDGRYRFSLYKLPPEALKTADKLLVPLKQGTGGLAIGNSTAQIKLPKNGFTKVEIELDIEAGKQNIEAWWGGQFINDANKKLGCFYIDVQRIGDRRYGFKPKTP